MCPSVPLDGEFPDIMLWRVISVVLVGLSVYCPRVPDSMVE